MILTAAVAAPPFSATSAVPVDDVCTTPTTPPSPAADHIAGCPVALVPPIRQKVSAYDLSKLAGELSIVPDRGTYPAHLSTW